MNVAEYIVRYVEYRGTEHAYVIVGGAALWICKALGQSSKLKFTFVNHEQAAVMGATVSAFEIIPRLFYPYLLCVSSLVFIFLGAGRKSK